MPLSGFPLMDIPVGNGESVETWEERGIASAEKSNFEEALSFFERAIDRKPSSRLHEYMAQCFMMIDGSEQRAVQAASAAVALDPNFAAGQLTLARASLNAGDFESAVAGFEAALALDESMKAEALEDLERASKLLAEKTARERDRELVMHGQALRICQGDGTEGEGTGSIVWECSVVLAMYLERHVTMRDTTVGTSDVTDEKSFANIDLSGCKTLELGSGTGVAGLAAAAVGAHVLLTDTEGVLPLLRQNMEINKDLLSCSHGCGDAEVQAFDWTDGVDVLHAILLSNHRKRRKRKADQEDGSTLDITSDLKDAMPQLVLAADLVFNTNLIKQLSAILHDLLSAGAVLLMAHKTRQGHVDAQMFQSLAEVGVELFEVPLKYHHPDFRSSRIRLFWGHKKEAALRGSFKVPTHVKPLDVPRTQEAEVWTCGSFKS